MVADAIRSGWILDNMPNPDTDIDLSLDRYIYYKKYGTLPSSRKRSGDEEKMRHISRFFQKLISPDLFSFLKVDFFICAEDAPLPIAMIVEMNREANELLDRLLCRNQENLPQLADLIHAHLFKKHRDSLFGRITMTKMTKICLEMMK